MEKSETTIDIWEADCKQTTITPLAELGQDRRPDDNETEHPSYTASILGIGKKGLECWKRRYGSAGESGVGKNRDSSWLFLESWPFKWRGALENMLRLSGSILPKDEGF